MTTDIAEQNIHNNGTDIHTQNKSVYVTVISTELKLSFY